MAEVTNLKSPTNLTAELFWLGTAEADEVDDGTAVAVSEGGAVPPT